MFDFLGRESLITWSCHVCGEERYDAQISVAKPLAAGLQDLIPGQVFNLRYCNDRPACIAVATDPDLQWPPTAAAGLCIPAQNLHVDPHTQGCASDDRPPAAVRPDPGDRSQRP